MHASSSAVQVAHANAKLALLRRSSSSSQLAYADILVSHDQRERE
jgi:hypothetical protein